MDFKAFKTSYASEALVSHSGNIASTRRSQGIPEGAGAGREKTNRNDWSIKIDHIQKRVA